MRKDVEMVSKDENELEEWEGDKLGRRKDAVFLTNYLVGKFENSRKEESFVLNLNAEWGYGKTFFLKKWEEDLKAQGYPVIYYDAWRSDFSNEPLMAFMSEFYSQILPYLGDAAEIKSTLREFFKAALKYRKPVQNALLKKFIGATSDELAEDAEGQDGEDTPSEEEGAEANVASGLLDGAIDKYLEDYVGKKKSIDHFKNKADEVAQYINDKVEGKSLPIFVFVDELDRCRPTYSIELLENIKHLFLSDSICFVIATDSDQLGKSIKAVYGNEFDSGRYLNRFFDHEYVIPEPDNLKFSEFLCGEYGLEGDSMFTPLDSISETFSILANYFRLRLREQHHVVAMLEAIKISQMDSSKKDIDVFYLLFLLMLKITKPVAFKRYSFCKRTPDLIKDTTLNEDEYDQSVEVPVKVRRRDPNSGHTAIENTTVTLYEIIDKYASYHEVNLLGDEWRNRSEVNFFYRKLRDRFSDQSPREYMIGATLSPDICDYIKIVNQVGQLS